MKTHEWKAMGRVIYGSRKTAFFEEKKANLAARTGRRITSMLPQIGLKENSVQLYVTTHAEPHRESGTESANRR
jgi:hypothetical protein